MPAIAHDHRYEATAREYYLLSQHSMGNVDLAVRPCGLLLHPVYSYIGASPDGPVYDPLSPDPHGLLEIKCPYRAFSDDLTPTEACSDPTFCCHLSGSKISLKRDHSYFYQIQGQLGVSGLSWCDFLVWTGPGRIAVERIHFDEDFWKDTVLKPLKEVYHKFPCVFIGEF